MLSKKKPTAQGNGLSRDSANAAAAATVPVPHSHAGPEVGVNKKSPLGKGASLSTYVLSATGYLFDCRRNHITVMALDWAHRYRGYVTWRFFSHHFLIRRPEGYRDNLAGSSVGQ